MYSRMIFLTSFNRIFLDFGIRLLSSESNVWLELNLHTHLESHKQRNGGFLTLLNTFGNTCHTLPMNYLELKFCSSILNLNKTISFLFFVLVFLFTHLAN